MRGYGDQGTVYGYATNETREMLPLPLVLAHRIVKRVDTVRKDKIVKGILPDGKAQVALSYAIGKADPVAVDVNSFGTAQLGDEVLREIVLSTFNLRPAAIIENLRLRNAIYEDTAVYGHFNSCLFPWEDYDMYKEIRKAADKYDDRKDPN